jgi:sulfatase maturation enzyme AslB (radical SAM superfamily)
MVMFLKNNMNLISAKDFFIFENCPTFIYDNKVIIFNYGNFIEIEKKDFNKNKKKIKDMIHVKVGYKHPDPCNPILTFILTRNCNMRCKYCSVYAGDFKENIKFDTIKTTIDNSVNKETKQVNIIFFGGEPTLC